LVYRRRALLYVVVQTLGAVIGAGVLKGLSSNATTDALLCTPTPGTGISAGQAFGIEMFVTFILVFTVFATCDSLRSGFGGSGPLAIGLSLTMCHLWAVRIRLYCCNQWTMDVHALPVTIYCSSSVAKETIKLIMITSPKVFATMYKLLFAFCIA